LTRKNCSISGSVVVSVDWNLLEVAAARAKA